MTTDISEERTAEMQPLKPSLVSGFLAIVVALLSAYIGRMFAVGQLPVSWLHYCGWRPPLTVGVIVITHATVLFVRKRYSVFGCRRSSFHAHFLAVLYLFLAIFCEPISEPIGNAICMHTDNNFTDFLFAFFHFLLLVFTSLAFLWGITLFRKMKVDAFLIIVAAFYVQVYYCMGFFTVHFSATMWGDFIRF